MSEKITIGIDLGGTRIKIGLVENGTVKDLKIAEARSKDGLKGQLIQLEQIMSLWIKKNSGGELAGIGLSFPGIVDSVQNRVIDTSSKYPDAPSLDLTHWAKEAFGVPFKMDNDARLACLGEWHYGAGKGTANMVMVTLGTGIGTSAIIDNRILRGRHFQAGILGGHIILDYQNQHDVCSCGRYGCAEGVASMWMIEKKAKQDALFGNSMLADEEKINWESIVKHSKAGDALAVKLKAHCLDVWSAAIINLVHAYDPDRIVIGGGISHTEDGLLSYFEKELTNRAWCPGGIPELRLAEHPDTAAILGAAALFE